MVLQNDIDKLQEWAKVSQMCFNYRKCKSMHFGRNNPENVYTMKLEDNQIHQIEKTELERVRHSDFERPKMGKSSE